jgi:hypothetical protein
VRRVGFVLDLVAVTVFVAIGRSVHAHGLTLSGLVSTEWPFFSGLALGWMAVAAARGRAISLGGGATVWLSTVAIGMVLRVLAGQGTALAFVLVALGFLGATLLSWRALLLALDRHRRQRHHDLHEVPLRS